MANTQIPTTPDQWTNPFFQEHLGKALQWALKDTQNDLLCDVERNIRPVESPLEAAFIAWWHAMHVAQHGLCLWPHPQKEVTAQDQSYRLDFALYPTQSGYFCDLTDHPLCPKIAIELDGHEFHERTKEQVIWRNRRDRALVAEGWVVWHFSGSEFHRDPQAVVFQGVYLEAVSLYGDAMRAAGFWRTFLKTVE